MNSNQRNQSNDFDLQIAQLKQGIVYTKEEIETIIDSIKTQYPNTSIKRVCAYGRVSTKYEEQESSLLTQHTVFSTYCEYNRHKGYVLVEEIYEQKSGTKASKRYKFMQMIEDAKQGLYDILLFKDSKRFSRNSEDFLGLIEELKRLNIFIVFINENVSTETADRTTLSMLGMMAESYSNSLHTNLQAVIKIKQNSELGRVPTGVFGYKRVKGNSSLAEIVPEQAELIRELFNRYAGGEGISSIASDWIERDIRTYRGNKMSLFALRRFIRNPLYKGLLVMGRYTKTDVRADRIKLPDDELIIRERPDLQIIDTELWDLCNEIMDSNLKTVQAQGSFKKTDKIRDKLFSKKIVCGCCGRNYNRKESHHKDKNKRYIYLMCGYKKYNKNNTANSEPCTNEKVIRLDTLTEVMSLFISDLLKNQDNLRDLVYTRVDSIIREMRKTKVDKSAEDSLKKAKEKLKRVAMLFKDDLVSEDEYKEARSSVKQLEEKLRSTAVMNITENEINELVDKFIDNLDDVIRFNLTDDSGLDIKKFNSLFENIVVYEDHIDIIFKVFSDRRLKQINKIDVKELLPEEHRDLRFVCPVIDNKISCCQLLDKFEPYSIEERQYLNSIDDIELRNKLRKKLHRKRKKTKQYSERTSEILGINSEAVINQHTNQVVAGLRDIEINLYVH